MADDLLTAVDEAFVRALQHRPKRRPARAEPDPAPHLIRDQVPTVAEGWWRLSGGTQWLTLFLAIQFLWGLILFVPGTQAIRTYVRALPYLSSLVFLGVYFTRRISTRRPAAAAWALGVLVLLAINLLHPTSQLTAGIAQCLFQLSIVAPVFWAYKAIRSPRQLEKLLLILFLMNFASAGLGVLQVYFPDQFMPPEFNSLGIQLNEYYVQSLTYVGRDGRMIIRPTGLTDQPGGAALAGALAAVTGLGLLLHGRLGLRKIALGMAMVVSLAAIYLTQVRSVLLLVIGSVVVISTVAFRQGRRTAAIALSLGGGTVIVVAFLWASSVGGASVNDRFLSIQEHGAVRAYQENRGSFLSYTINELLDEYPLGAGVGRWGMMNTYFGDHETFKSSPIYVEIQLTGWLLDGGWPMWILYGGGIVVSILSGLRLATGRDRSIHDSALAVTALQIFVAGMSMVGPVFNTQLGILFWTLSASLHGAAAHTTNDQTAFGETRHAS